MATETITIRVCDMPHTEGDVPAEPFELYSRKAGRYEVDLCAACARVVFAPAVANGRKVKRSVHTGR